MHPKQRIWLMLTLLAVLILPAGAAIAAWTSPAPTAPDVSGARLTSAAAPLENSLQGLEETLAWLTGAGDALSQTAMAAQEEEAAIAQELAALVEKTSANKNLSDEAYEKIIVSRLGNPVYSHEGKNSSLLLFKLEKADFRGYMAKIKLKNSKALRVTLAPEDQPKGETPLAAVERLGGIFGVNGGGFATATENGVARLAPLGNTMLEGKLVGDFLPSWNNLAFAGFTQDNQLKVGIYDTEEELLASGVWQGVSFVPVLVQDWEPQTIPKKWAKARQPRTVLGQYPNGDIFFIVVDGRQSNWSNGITLEEMQVLLLQLGVMEAFNLDGGGSSAMVYDGQVLNKPSDGSLRKMATNIVVMP